MGGLRGPHPSRDRPLIQCLRSVEDPHKVFDDLRSQGPVCPDGFGSWFVFGREEAEQALSEWPVPDQVWMERHRPDWLESSMRQCLNKSLLNTNAPVHSELRNRQARLLSARSVAGMRPMAKAFFDEAMYEIGELLAYGPADFATVFNLVPVKIVASLLGIPQADVPELARLSGQVGAANDLSPAPSVQRMADEAVDQMLGYLCRLGPAGSPLARACSTAGNHAVANTAVYLVAGTVTTASLLNQILLYWMTYLPDVASPEARAAVVEEVLRLEPPVHAVSRYVPTDSQFGGHLIQAGQIVHIMVAAANRDPSWFAAPHAFVPGRTEHGLSFGQGAHYCVGSALARMEGDILLELLAKHATGWETAGPVEYEPNVLLQRISRQPIRQSIGRELYRGKSRENKQQP